MLMRLSAGICSGLLLSAAMIDVAETYVQGDWLFRFGASNVDPKSDNHEIVSVDDANGATLNLTCMFTDRWPFEVLAACAENMTQINSTEKECV